jgi:ribosomal protein S11
MDFKGNVKFFCSAGEFEFKGKRKASRLSVLKHFFNVIAKKSYLINKPIALHLNNVSFNKLWIVNILKKKFFLKIIKTVDLVPHNGCRKPKVRRKKLRLKKIKLTR